MINMAANERKCKEGSCVHYQRVAPRHTPAKIPCGTDFRLRRTLDRPGKLRLRRLFASSHRVRNVHRRIVSACDRRAASYLPPAVAELLTSALAYDPEDRPKDADAFAREVGQAVSPARNRYVS